MADATPVKWDTTYDKAWAAKVAQWEWTWTDDNTVETHGMCPHCIHPMTREVRRASVRTLLAVSESEDELVPVVVACNCTATHPEQPEGQLGCGKQATFMLPL